MSPSQSDTPLSAETLCKCGHPDRRHCDDGEGHLVCRSVRDCQSIGSSLTPRQREAIKHLYVAAGDPPDLYDYVRSGALAWRNRERVLDALKRRGLTDDDGALTDAGVVLAEKLLDVSPSAQT